MTVVSNDETMTGHIATYTGEVMEPLNPDPPLIHLRDIAHALSNNCRFTGHTRSFYSVAQHCVLASQIVPKELALTALMHDASEAYLSDISRPIKMQPEFGDVYKKYEKRLEEAIAVKFRLVYPFPPEVKWADNVLLRSEQRDLMPDAFRHEGDDYLPQTIVPWLPAEAERTFLVRFNQVVGWTD
jgi:hypothetical protein